MLLKPIFLIAAPSYTVESGGAMVLHHLCHLLNEFSEAYLLPMPIGEIVNWLNFNDIERIVATEQHKIGAFNTCSDLNTPVFSGDLNKDKFVAVYPEVVLGNPFQLQHVARWVLYHSGFHRGFTCTTKGEVEFKFNEEFTGASIPGFSETANMILKIAVPNVGDYTTLRSNVGKTRSEMLDGREGVAYCVRKGQLRECHLIDDDAICIDGKNINEVTAILKKVKYFVSFDPHTYFSNLAVVQGCYSMVSCPTYDGAETSAAATRPFLAFSKEQLDSSWDNRSALLDMFDENLVLARQNAKEFHQFWLGRLNSLEPA